MPASSSSPKAIRADAVECCLDQRGPLVWETPLSPGMAAEWACLLEATAPKPGNVHPGASFDDLKYGDFVASAAAIRPAMEQAGQGGRVGEAVLQAVQATRSAVQTNTNLGTILLLAPMAAVPANEPLKSGVSRVLDQLDRSDAASVYQAIRFAQPGGLGKVQEADVHAAPPDSLLSAMQLAAERDLVARQYANGFQQVLQVAAWLKDALSAGRSLRNSIVQAHVRLMAAEPDSLIARKCGAHIAAESAHRAASALASFDDPARCQTALAELDAWLRADGHRRNPGTTADLIAAGLYVLVRETAGVQRL